MNSKDGINRQRADLKSEAPHGLITEGTVGRGKLEAGDHPSLHTVAQVLHATVRALCMLPLLGARVLTESQDCGGLRCPKSNVQRAVLQDGPLIALLAGRIGTRIARPSWKFRVCSVLQQGASLKLLLC